MSNNLIFSSEIKVSGNEQDKAWGLWKENGALNMPKGAERRCFRLEEDSNHFLEIIAIESLNDIESLISEREVFNSSLAPLMVSDWHRQVFNHVESVKPISGKLPQTSKLQLRYIEVPLSVHDAYLEWRENTIFDVVRSADEVQCFLAYHTLFSTQPGVMFFSGFDGDSKQYMSNVFLTPRYKKIIQEAGSKYIAGGENGLYTRIFIAE